MTTLISHLRRLGAISCLGILATLHTPTQVRAEVMMGEVRLFAFNFCPRGWAALDGADLSIATQTALFSLLGVTYGGDGRTTFKVPDLRGRAPINAGKSPGLYDRKLGQKSGDEGFVIKNASQLPAHSHGFQASSKPGDKRGPGGDSLAPVNQPGLNIFYSGAPDTQMDPATILPTGKGAPIEHTGPRLALTFCIAVEGIYPSK